MHGQEKIQSVGCVSRSFRDAGGLGDKLCQVVHGCKHLLPLTLVDSGRKGKPIDVVDVEVTKDDDFRGRMAGEDALQSDVDSVKVVNGRTCCN